MKVTLKNRYEIDTEKNLLGKGGFGSIYKCYDNLLEKSVSAKIVNAPAYYRGSIYREFKVVAKLRHQNIIGYYDLIEIEKGENKEKQFAILMDFANYGTLRDLIYSNNLRVDTFTELLLGIFEGLRYIHNHGIIHRDLKPSNILIHKDNITEKLTPLLSDFLSSQYLKENYDSFEFEEVDPERTVILGTIEYMAPERYDDLSVIGPMTDLWSIGVIIYEFFKKELPFQSRKNSTFLEIAKRIIEEEIDLSGIPSPFNEIIKICLVKDLSSRVSDVEILIKLLTKAQGSKFEDIEFKEEIKEDISRIELLSMEIEDKFIKQVQELKKEIDELKREEKREQSFNKNNLFTLIRDNRIEDCFQSLSDFEVNFNRDERKSLIILQSQWNDIKHKERVGIVGAGDVFILHNKIRNHLIDFINEIKPA